MNDPRIELKSSRSISSLFFIFQLVGCFGFNGPLRHSISGRLPKRGRKRREMIDESKNVQTTRTYGKCSRPLPYYTPNCRTARHWKLPSTIAPPDHPPLVFKQVDKPKNSLTYIRIPGKDISFPIFIRKEIEKEN